MSEVQRLLVRAPNWLGDAVMALPALAAVRRAFVGRTIVIAAIPAVAPIFDEGTEVAPDQVLTIDRARATNEMIRAICSRDDRVAFLDVDGVMLGWDEKPRRELFAEDGLHLSPQGYQLWTTLLRPFLNP